MEAKLYFLVDSRNLAKFDFISKKSKIPLALINARITIKTFNKWIKFPKTAKKFLVLLIYVLLQMMKQNII